MFFQEVNTISFIPSLKNRLQIITYVDEASLLKQCTYFLLNKIHTKQ